MTFVVYFKTFVILGKCFSLDYGTYLQVHATMDSCLRIIDSIHVVTVHRHLLQTVFSFIDLLLDKKSIYKYLARSFLPLFKI